MIRALRRIWRWLVGRPRRGFQLDSTPWVFRWQEIDTGDWFLLCQRDEQAGYAVPLLPAAWPHYHGRN
jgi:hypothetical protein